MPGFEAAIAQNERPPIDTFEASATNTVVDVKPFQNSLRVDFLAAVTVNVNMPPALTCPGHIFVLMVGKTVTSALLNIQDYSVKPPVATSCATTAGAYAVFVSVGASWEKVTTT